MRSPVLYLDFDGVLSIAQVLLSPTIGVHIDDPDHTLFEYAPQLVSALDAFPEVRIVLSTSWVPAMGYAATTELLRQATSNAFVERVVGATCDDVPLGTWDAQSRYQQIRADAQRRKLADRWLAIDDNDLGWPAGQRGKLVHTKACGLRAPDLERLVVLLTKLRSSER